ncbi:MAG: phosphatase PAP2 family protein [Spirochaetaceae bacterium]|nr:phosphatase PAP2 family protein [Spirochaetaceae bacterium]
MNPILAWGLGVVEAVQRFFGPKMLVPMEILSFLGSEFFAFAVLPFLYWCIDRRKGAKIGIVIIFSGFVNSWLKMLFMQPRPYDLAPELGLAREDSPGLPSGHSQTSVTFWGLMLSVLPKTPGRVLLILVPLLVGISRLYLGVHFPTDVLAGWAVGAVIVVLANLLEPKLKALFGNMGLRFQLILAAAVAILMNFLLPSGTMLSGIFLGCAVGFALTGEKLRFDANGTAVQKILRYIIGDGIAALVYIVPKLILGEDLASGQPLVRFIRYAILGIWISFGAPWCFTRMKLMKLEEQKESGEPGELDEPPVA